MREEPGSRLFLGLAEELLRRGEREEALAVLDAGLAARPGQVAATVAKARCLVELERPLEARGSARAPCCGAIPPIWWRRSSRSSCGCACGDLDRARASLERYAPLGAADPDLVRLGTRLRELEDTQRCPQPPRARARRRAAPATTRHRADRRRRPPTRTSWSR